MRNIIIYNKDESTGIELPITRNLSIGGQSVDKEITMAAGNRVKYIIGYRATITAKWDYFPQDVLTELHALIRQGGWFKVRYPDLDGADNEGYFSVSQSSMGVFTYQNNTPMWRGLTLTFTAREVE